MKRILKITAFVLVLVIGSSMRNKVSAQYRDDISYQTFYDELSPYGQWVQYPEYGYVWVPDVDRDFQPYSTNGHWVWTDDYDWMWVSDYDWGWAPFHYGRWMEDDYYGWFWVPGYEWSPAWVAWRDGGDYYGWAPLRPGVNISINFNIGGYNPPNDYWCFVPRRYIASAGWYNYRMNRGLNITIINQTTIINNFNYSSNIWRTGPRRYDAEIYCGRITSYRIRDSYSPGRDFYRGNEVRVYRPVVRHDNDRQFAPRQFQRYDQRGNGNGFRRGDNGAPRDNNLPRRDFGNRDNDGRPAGGGRPGFDRNRRDPNDGGQPNNGDRRTFDRRNDNNGGNGRPDWQGRDQQPRQPQEERRNFDRRNDNNGGNNNGNNGPRYQRPDPQPQEPRRTFDRRNDNNGGGQPQQRQFERRNDNNGGGQPQQRQFERRNDNNGGNRPSGNNGGGGGHFRRG